MEFENRIKKEMTEGIVRALLDDAGYRVIEYGVEKTAREVTPMSREEYLRLCLPDSVSKTPDLLVLDRTQTAWWLVEIKYRSQWGGSVLDEVEAQVRQFGELVLVSIAGSPENPQNMDHTPARYPSVLPIARQRGCVSGRGQQGGMGRRWRGMGPGCLGSGERESVVEDEASAGCVSTDQRTSQQEYIVERDTSIVWNIER